MSAIQVHQAIERILAGVRPADCESVSLDFKEDTGQKGNLEASVAKAAICFANSAGGTIVIGVSDKGAGLSAFTGTSMPAEQLRQRVHEITKPPLLVDVEELEKPARLLLVKVPATGTIHADSQGRSWQRINTDCIPLTPSEQAKLSQERSGFDWSAECSNRTVGQVLPEALASARLLLTGLSDERREIARRTDIDLLSALGVLFNRSTLNRAGEVMFCSPEIFSDIFVYQYKITPAGEPRTVQRLTLPLLTAFPRMMELVSARQSTTPVTMPNGQQITIEDFPLIAVREALSNAICHRDWQAPGVIAVDHAPEVFSVTSPGPLVSGVTPENILTMPSRPRNRCLANAVRLLGLAEETGRGVDRMYRETIRSGRQPPNIEGFPDRARVSFVGGAPDTNIARFVARLPEHEREDTDTMLVLYTLCKSTTITAAQIAPILQKPVSEALAVLRRLASDNVGLLETTKHSVGRSRQVYRLRGEALRGLGSAVAYNRRTVDETDRKVIEHVREYGKVTNRTLQNLFDVHVFRARDIISGLQQRGVLTRISEQARGSKVEWGPGPNFPRIRQRRRKPQLDTSETINSTDDQTELQFGEPHDAKGHS
jgi:ATP-dependent DNA helicase RecG